MCATTSIRHHADMTRKPVEHCHDGTGTMDSRVVWEQPSSEGSPLKFMQDNVLPPGATIGIHTHNHDEEYYYIIAGEGEMILDGERHSVRAGDITAVYPEGEHGLENTGNGPLRFLVMALKR